MRPIVVFNPHAWNVRLNVELESGVTGDQDVLLDDEDRQVPLQQVQSQGTAPGRVRLSFPAELPSLGYRTYRVAVRPPSKVFPSLAATDSTMENDRFYLEFDPATGCIKRLYDKIFAHSVFLDAAARPVVIDDPSDTWGHNVFRFDQVVGEFVAESVRRVEHGPVKSVIRVVSRYGASRLVQDFCMYPGVDQIDVHVNVDWREQFKMLKLRFPLNLQLMSATFETPYGHIERFANGEEEPMQSWVDVSGVSKDNGRLYGVSILNDGKYSADVNIRDIGLTVLRSPIYAHHMPVIPEADGQYAFIDQGIQSFHYSLLPHSGSWESVGTVRRAAELNQRPIALAETFHPDGALPQADSFLSVDAENVIVSVVKQAEGSQDWIIRAYETHQAATHVTICVPRWNRVIQADLGPCEIKTWRVPRDPQLPAVEINLLEM
jgi:alpha-mannosidase